MKHPIGDALLSVFLRIIFFTELGNLTFEKNTEFSNFDNLGEFRIEFRQFDFWKITEFGNFNYFERICWGFELNSAFLKS